MPPAIFHAQTPYHILCAVAAATTAGRSADDSWLLVSTMHPSQRDFFERSQPMLSTWFSRTICLSADPPSSPTRRARRAIGAAINVRRIERLVRHGQVGDVFTSNLQTVEGAALAHATRTTSPTGRVHLVEDGLATYELHRSQILANEPGPASPPAARRLMRGRSAGVPLNPLPAYLAATLLAARPDLLDPATWDPLEVQPLPLEVTRPLASQLIRSSWPDAKLDQLEALVLLPHSSMLDADADGRAIEASLRSLGPLGRIGIKYHPREPTRYLESTLPNAVELPTEVPAELVMAAAAETLRHVVSGRTTALITAATFSPRAALTLLPGTQLVEPLRGRIRADLTNP